ncbi:MAG: hypothetical protein Q8P31_02710 [Bacillota bacterium]|nr:hypothetical protein [Bacillota bacterium]
MSICRPLPCADLGSAFCPCALASAGQCVYCTRLRGEDRCACDWAGVCVLLHRGGRGAPDAPGAGADGREHVQRSIDPPAVVRRGRLGTAAAARTLARGVRELRVLATHSGRAQLARPGTFVLIRRASRPDRYDVPLTVAGVDGDTFRLIFKVAGPKTRSLAAAADGEGLVWRGPYYSGLIGLRRLLGDRGRPRAAVIVTRGLGQAVALPVLAHLAGRGTETTVLLDPRGWGGDFARRELEAVGGGPAADVACMERAGAATLTAALRLRSAQPGAQRGAVLVVSCGSDLQHRWLVGLQPQLRAANGGAPVQYVAVNNALVVCGEGVCGACIRRLPDGTRFRGCKADIPPELLWPPQRGWGRRSAGALPASEATAREIGERDRDC